MAHKPELTMFDRLHLGLIALIAVTGGVAYMRQSPGRIAALAVLLVIAWRAISGLEKQMRG
jgi:hypothetical protein